MKALLADIGGTNARFAVYAEGRIGGPIRLATADYATAEAAIAAAAGQLGCEMDVAVLAVAGPVLNGQAALTNAGWRFDEGELAARFRLRAVRLANDFEVIALAVPWLELDDLMDLGGGQGDPESVILVMGPGTGLGMAGLVDGRRALVGEGGHVTLAAADARDSAIIEALRERFGHVSAERVLSGDGLVHLLGAIAALEGGRGHPAKTAEDVVMEAERGDALAELALDSFFGFLGNVAGNAALTLGARGGVYFAGGILPRVKDRLLASRFQRSFLAKGRFEAYLAEIPLRLVLHPDPAFIGLATIADGWRED
jgi:glucokinase